MERRGMFPCVSFTKTQGEWVVRERFGWVLTKAFVCVNNMHMC